MVRQCLGQTRTQVPHCTQRNGSMAQVRSFFSPAMAWAGQLLAQMPHRMHALASFALWPLSPAGAGFCSKGYSTVSGFLNREPKVMPPSLKLPMLAYLSVQLMQGSMVRMIILTSAKSHPFRATVMPARFCEVGVRMRMRSRFFDPLPRA